jgi:hypothetical protein
MQQSWAALLAALLVACDGGMAMDFDRALHAHPGWPQRHLALRGGAGRDAEGLTRTTWQAFCLFG